MKMPHVLTYCRELAGVLLLDVHRYLSATSSTDTQWLTIRNRREDITLSPDGGGVICNWKWSSELHAPRILPFLGTRIMQCAFRHCPVRILADASSSDTPEVSFIIGHRGTARLALLLLTLESIAAQQDIQFECIVVEQSCQREVELALPKWVRYIHTPVEEPGSLYNRAHAFNVGAARARGRVLVFHDNDLMVPECYASEIKARFDEGYDVVNLKRYIFYLSNQHTLDIIENRDMRFDRAPESIVQNAVAGGSIGVGAAAFHAIGGFDEKFVGWGGEDNEFRDRAETLKLYPYTYLPILHLWHAPQPGKTPAKNTPGMHRYDQLRVVDATERISRLRRENAAYRQTWEQLRQP